MGEIFQIDDLIRNLKLKKKSRKRNIAKSKRSLLREFLRDTSCHVFKCVADYRRHWIERVMWLTIFILSLLFCLNSTYMSYLKWESHSFMKIFDTKMTPISEVPLPAITICLKDPIIENIKFNHSNWDSIVKGWKHNNSWLFQEKITSNKTVQFFTKLRQSCKQHIQDADNCEECETFVKYCRASVLRDEDIVPFLQLIGKKKGNAYRLFSRLPGSEALNRIVINEYDSRSVSIETTTLTAFGICRTFNSLNTRELFNIEK